MKRIVVFDWAGGGKLVNGRVEGIENNVPFQGTDEDAIRLAGLFFLTGVNVMLCHVKEPLDDIPTVVIYIDDRRFTQR